MKKIGQAISKIRNDLGLQVLLLYVLFMLPVILGGAIFDYTAGERLRRDVMAADLSLARAIAHETETALVHAMNAVEQLATFPAVQNAESAKIESLFSQVFAVRPDVNLIYRLDKNGTMLFHYPSGPTSTVGTDFSFREYFQASLNTTQPLISLGRVSPTTQQAVATSVMPIWIEDEFNGLVAMNIKLASFSDTLAQITGEHQLENRLTILIVDANGQVIAHPDNQFLLMDVGELMPELRPDYKAGSVGNFILTNPKGEEILTSIVRIPVTGWAVIVSRPTAVAFAALDSIHQSVLWIILLFIVIGLFFWWFLSRRVLSPIELLASYSQAIGLDHELERRQIDGLNRSTERQDQLGHLTRSFRRMHADVMARFEEQATLLDTSAAVVSTLDSQDVLIRILQQAQRLLDLDMCAIVALDQGANIFRAVASLGLSKRYAEQLAISPDEHDSPTMRAIRLGEVVQIYDTDLDPSFAALRPRARAEGYRSFASIPLRTTHAQPAALVVYNPHPKTYNSRELSLLSHFANHAAMAIENAELYARSDERWQAETRRMQALVQSMESGLIMEDLNGTVLYANRVACDYGACSMETLVGKPVRHYYAHLLAKAHHPDKMRAALDGFLFGNEESISIEEPFNFNEGQKYLRIQGFVVKDVTGQMIGRGQILRDITRRYQLDRMKSSLISTASHELRTPLAVIKGYATTLLAKDVNWDRDAQLEFLEAISTETDRINDLVNNLLDMSRIEAGNLELKYLAATPEELIENAILRTFPRPDVPIQVQIDPKLPFLSVDATRIEVVLQNLLENAVKYAGPHARIIVRAKRVGECVEFQVEDDGPGIPIGEQEYVFTSFYRVESENIRNISGVGLGLSICRGFVDAHGGKIWINGERPGTCIVFQLPVDPQSPLALKEQTPVEQPR